MTDSDDPSISETREWLLSESTHSGQIVERHDESRAEPRFAESIPVSEPVANAMQQRGFAQLYRHQFDAIDAAQSGENVVLATQTASGKSLPYSLLAIDRALDRKATTVYIAPMKALINDQASTLREFAAGLPDGADFSVGVYTGSTTKQEKREIRGEPADFVLMTPELVHQSLVPYHNLWHSFIQRLETVVIDEIHAFKGVFGSHVGLTLRRLNRLLETYGRELNYFCCSATIGNPVDHAANITGQDPESFHLLDEDTSGRGRRLWQLYNPPLKSQDRTQRERHRGEDDSTFGEYPDNWDEIRHRVYNRDNHQCQECGAVGGKEGTAEIHAHHIVSPAAGGTHELANLKTLCAECHSDEHGRPVGKKARTAGSKQRSTDSTPANQGNTPGEIQEEYERKSNHPVSIRLFTELVARGHQTLVFTGARQGAAQYVKESANRLESMGRTEVADQIVAYHGALNDAEREQIEQGLRDGDVRGVWSTNALELGVDIGGMDAVIADGYPGTNINLFQQTGRAGRGVDDCLILMVARPNPLDQYCVANPDVIFNEPPGDATIDTSNQTILTDHVLSAAAEIPLTISDEQYFPSNFPDVVSELTAKGKLQRESKRNGIQWVATEDDIQYEMTLRGEFKRSYDLIDEARTEQIGELPVPDVLRDCHPEAIYNHRMRTYQVVKFDETNTRITLREKDDLSGFTRPLADRAVEVTSVQDRTRLHNDVPVQIGFADLIYEEQVEGYLQYDHAGDESPTENYFDEALPKYYLETKGLFLTLPGSLESRLSSMTNEQDAVVSALHAVEHAVRSIFPLEVLCSQADIDGYSMMNHTDTGKPTIFIFDTYAGGAGVTESGYDQLKLLLQKSKELIDSCDCISGCPSCIHLQQCASRNQVLNKDLGRFVLTQLLDDTGCSF